MSILRPPGATVKSNDAADQRNAKPSGGESDLSKGGTAAGAAEDEGAIQRAAEQERMAEYRLMQLFTLFCRVHNVVHSGDRAKVSGISPRRD